MALRTKNDTFVTRTATTYPLEQIGVAVFTVHGTADRVVPFSHAKAIEAQVPGAELLAIVGGERVSIFAHRNAVII
jgi:pimeloyl-ACP methyl ester carboxylesterase